MCQRLAAPKEAKDSVLAELPSQRREIVQDDRHRHIHRRVLAIATAALNLAKELRQRCRLQLVRVCKVVQHAKPPCVPHCAKVDSLIGSITAQDNQLGRLNLSQLLRVEPHELPRYCCVMLLRVGHVDKADAVPCTQQNDAVSRTVIGLEETVETHQPWRRARRNGARGRRR